MRHPIIIVFCIAFFIRLGYVLLIQFLHPNSIYLFDSWGYLNIAHNLFNDGVFTQMTAEPQTPDSTRTPFYPLYIYLFHLLQLNGEWIVIIQAVVGAATAAVAAQCAMLIRRNRVAAFLVGLFVAIDLPSVLLANTVMTETWFSFFLIIAIYYLIKSIKYEEPQLRIYVVLALVCAAYTRPAAIYLLLIIPIFLFIVNQHGWIYELKQACIFLALGAVLVSPWYYRNYQTFGAPFFSSIAETNFLFHTTSNIKAKINGTTRRIEEYKYRENPPLSEYSFTHNARVIPLFQKFARKECIQTIKEHPRVAIKIFAKSWIGFFTKPMRSLIGRQLYGRKWNAHPPLTMVDSKTSYWSSFLKAYGIGTFVENVLLTFQILLLALLYISILMAVPIWFKENQLVGIMLIIMVLFFSITSSITDVDARFRVPVVALLGLLAYPFWLKLLKRFAHE